MPAKNPRIICTLRKRPLNRSISHDMDVYTPPNPTDYREERKKPSLEIIPVDLIRHHHHPQQEHGAHDLEREGRPPVGAEPLVGQPRGRLLAVDDVDVWSGAAVAVDGAGGPVELDGGFDEPREEEDEEDEGAEDDDAGEELLLGDEAEEEDDEEDAEGGGGDHVGEDPVC